MVVEGGTVEVWDSWGALDMAFEGGRLGAEGMAFEGGRLEVEGMVFGEGRLELKGKVEMPRPNLVKQYKRLTASWVAVVQWNHARFGLRGVSKCTGSNPVHGPSVGRASSLGVTVP
ncbi:hypothetical protein E2C01_053716 [Portunus trituberculatus]|uniref:Uncharacterized protein n=1 Tax=Portunus trituberculatus TaxID=210409 RepID=A0A5B7GHI3_PORTR|nr:hypothetical protein [Portunus trituberculatus]